MDNITYFSEFYILAFSAYAEKCYLIFSIFLLLYMIGVLWNLIIITVIYNDIHIHTPMYFFLASLSLVDIGYPTVTLPKLPDNLVSKKNTISLITCLTHTFFFMVMGGTEIMLLSSMAYDRYAAICNPLNYQLIMNRKKCSFLLGLSWGSAIVNAIFMILLASKLRFCRTNKIHQFFCDVKALSTISCRDVGFQIMIFVEALLYGLFPFVFSISSYVNIIRIILGIKTVEGRKKAFSTCTSHLVVVFLYYVTILCMYMRPPADNSDIMDHFFSILYSTVTPMLNPLIYSLRNKDVKHALAKLFKVTSL